MNKKSAGERVFTNVDEVLAKKIISRSVENCDNTQKLDNACEKESANKHEERFGVSKIIALFAVVIALVFAIKMFVDGFGDKHND